MVNLITRPIMEAISIGSLDSSSHDTDANLHRYNKKKNSYIVLSMRRTHIHRNEEAHEARWKRDNS